MSENKDSISVNLHKQMEFPISSRKPTNIRWQIFFLLLILSTVNYIDRAVLSIAMPAIQKDLSLDPAVIGVILSAFFWGYAPMQIPSGWVADRFRPDKLIFGSALLWGVVQVLTGFVTGSKALISLRVLLGIVEAPTYPSGTKLQSIWLTSRERGRGATLLDAGSSLGTALGGPVVVAFMAWLGGWRGALIGAGILTIFIAWLCWHFIKGTPNTNPRVNEAEREYLRNALDEEYETEKKQNSKIGAKTYLQHRNFWCMCIGFYSLNTVFYGLMTWGPSFLAKTQHLNIQTIGGSIFMIFGAGVAGELFGGWLSDKWRSNGGQFNTVMHTLLGIAGLMSCVSILLLGFTSSLAMAISLLCLALFFLRFAGLYWSVPAAIAHREHVGTLAGCMNFSGNIAGIVTPIVVGFIVSETGSYSMSLMMFALFGLLLAGASFFLNFNNKIGHMKGVLNDENSKY